jgi:hypothetical protein
MTHFVSAIVNQLVSDDLLTDMKSLTITGLDLQKFDGGDRRRSERVNLLIGCSDV